MGMSDVPGCYRDTVAMVMWLLCLAEAGMEHRESCLLWEGGSHRDPNSLSRRGRWESPAFALSASSWGRGWRLWGTVTEKLTRPIGMDTLLLLTLQQGRGD